MRTASFVGQTVTAPEVWILEEPRKRREFLHFLAQLGDLECSGSARKFVDLTRVNKIHPSATVLFKARLSLLTSSGVHRRIKWGLPKSNQIKQVFHQVGLFADLEKSVTVQVDREDVVHWRSACGNLVENSIIKTALEAYTDELPTPLRELLLGGAGEALANAVEHAYEYPLKSKHGESPKRGSWWAFFNYRDDAFYMAVCDLGCGIPEHIPQKHVNVIDKVRAVIGQNPLDAALIEAATSEGVSATDLPYRGKGLPRMVKELTGNRPGALRIFSNKGLVVWSKTESSAIKTNFLDSIFGTILIWEIKISETSQNED